MVEKLKLSSVPGRKRLSALVQELREKNTVKRLWEESKKTWHIALPAILTAVTQFSIDFITAAYVGHLGDVELAAVSEVQNVVEGFVYGVMLGMGSALETLCGQAVGAGQFDMLGIYMQRSWIISGVTALSLTPIYVFTSPILKALRQDREISNLAGKFAVWVIPQLYAYALNFPVQKFLQSQSKVWVMTFLSMAALGLHVLLNWVLVIKLNKGLLGAAMAGNISWWVLIVAQVVYVVSGCFPDSWKGFSWSAFKSLTNFVKLSLASAIMLCLEVWYFTAVILMVGGLKDAAIAVDAVSIWLVLLFFTSSHSLVAFFLFLTVVVSSKLVFLPSKSYPGSPRLFGSGSMNLQLWTLMIALGFNAAVSVRVSNELGAGKPNRAKLSILVNVLTSGIMGIIFAVIIIATKNLFPIMFTNKARVMEKTSKLGYLLAATIFLNSIQPVLHGVAVGAGWQFSVALLNVVCYYVIGLPIGAVLGYKLNMGVQGIWWAMLGGSLLQTIILLIIIIRTNWIKESLQAEDRVREWGGPTEPQHSS